MTTSTRPSRVPLLRRWLADNNDGDESRVLDYVDQAMFLGLRATGQAAVMQCVWVYEHPVDMEGLRRFHYNFGHGLAGRRIEPSILPFGRHRWVSSLGPPAPLRVYETVRPRAELGDFLDEHAQIPVDPEFGPAWHMGVQPLDDGATVVSLVGSHCIGDGGGAMLTVFESVTGQLRDLGLPQPRTRSSLQALRTDLRQTFRDLPELGRSIKSAAKQAYQKRSELRRSGKSAAAHLDAASAKENLLVPAIWAFIDAAEFEGRAKALGGNSYALIAGFAARLSERMGRFSEAEGVVPLVVPINDRTLEDTRANAVLIGDARVNPKGVTEDLTETRAIIKEALRKIREEPDEKLELLPLTPFVPKRAVTQAADIAVGFGELPVFCSNLGTLPDDLARVDGTPAEYLMARGVDGQVPRAVMEHRKGILTVISMQVIGRVSMAIIGYQPGAENTKATLRAHVEATLAEFGLSAVYE